MHTPPVYIDYIIILSYRLRRVSVLWSAPSSSRDRGGLPIPHSCRYCGINPGFDFLLESLSWFKPGERLSLANGWMCQYPWCKNTGVRTMVQTGGKVTCRNSRTARTSRRVSVLRPAPSSSRYRGSNHRGSNRGFSRLHWSAQPTLLSLLWYKRGVRLPPRVANMVQTPGETLAGKPVDVSVSIR